MTREKMIEALAKIIFEAMRFDRSDKVPPWAEGGNSLGQAEARSKAAAVLDLCGPEPLVWDYVANTHTWQAQSPYGEYSVGFDDGYWGQLIGNMPWEWEPDCDPRTYDGPDAAQAAAQSHADAAHWANTPLGELE